MTSKLLDPVPAAPSSMSRMKRWRRLLLAGWAMFLASFLLPVLGIEIMGTIEWLTVFPRMLEDALAAPETAELETRDVLMGLGQLSPVILLHVPMFMTLPALRAARVRGERWLGWVLGALGWTALGVGVLHLVLATLLELPRRSATPYSLIGREIAGGAGVARSPMATSRGPVPVALPPLGMGIGYWAWTASFFCVAAALWMRARELKPATPEPIGTKTA